MMIDPSVCIDFAVIFVMHDAAQFTAVANPDSLIVATSMSVDCHVTVSVTSSVVGSALNVPIARNWAVSPDAYKSRVPAAGRIVIPVNVLGPTVTVRLVVPEIPSKIAVIVVSPTLTAVASPEELTVATFVSLELHVA